MTHTYIKDKIGEDTLRFLQRQLAGILSLPRIRPWHYWEAHNPWGMSASVVDTWGCLDVCQDDFLTGLAARFIGEDLILYDSQFQPAPVRHQENGNWQCDADTCPATPHAGAVVRITIADTTGHTPFLELAKRGDEDDPDSINLHRGVVIAHDMHTRYRYAKTPDAAQPFEYVIRYFPATSQYQRRQHGDFQKRMNILYPLQNFAARPLWLVRGRDRADNDFVTGFRPRPGQWIGAEPEVEPHRK